MRGPRSQYPGEAGDPLRFELARAVIEHDPLARALPAFPAEPATFALDEAVRERTAGKGYRRAELPATAVVIDSLGARLAYEALEYRQAECERSPTDENRKALKRVARMYRAALRAQRPQR